VLEPRVELADLLLQRRDVVAHRSFGCVLSWLVCVREPECAKDPAQRRRVKCACNSVLTGYSASVWLCVCVCVCVCGESEM
jgi:hypothetical protein